ncbi:MAG TPA: ThuA domain-containing protein [Clostridiales bacterium]|nr:ThuA domain-containing protein [Clostridiales bacterium]
MHSNHNDRSNSILTKHEQPSDKKKRLLVLSKGWLHPSIWVRRKFRDMLLSFAEGEQNGSYEFTFTNRFEDLSRMGAGDASNDSQFDGIILLIHENKLSDKLTSEFISRIQRFLSQGGGLLAVHGALASFKSVSEYGRILGSRFIGHDAAGPVEIQEANASDSFMLKEELYLHNYDQSNNILWYSSCKGEKVPVAWTKEENRGRVFCFSLGHFASTFENKKVQKILHDAIAWITRQVNEL